MAQVPPPPKPLPDSVAARVGGGEGGKVGLSKIRKSREGWFNSGFLCMAQDVTPLHFPTPLRIGF